MPLSKSITNNDAYKKKAVRPPAMAAKLKPTVAAPAVTVVGLVVAMVPLALLPDPELGRRLPEVLLGATAPEPVPFFEPEPDIEAVTLPPEIAFGAALQDRYVI